MAALLRLLFLAEHSYWVDELFSIEFARQSIPEIIRVAATQDAHPPLYYVLLSLWMSWFGESEMATRSLSVVLGVLFVGVVFGLGTVLYGRRVGILAGVLSAGASFAIYYAQEARMYTLLAFLAVLSTFFLWKACGRATIGRLSAYVLTATLLVYTHNYGLFMVAAHAAYVGSLLIADEAWRRENLKKWFVVGAVVAALYLPWMVVLTGQIKALKTEGFWITTPTLYTIAGSFSEYVGGDAILRVAAALLLALAFVPMLRKLASALRQRNLATALQSHESTATYLLGLCLLVPIAAGFVISHVSMPIYHTRYTMVGYFAFWLLIARGISLIPRTWAQSAVLVLLVVFGVKVLTKEGYVHRNRAGFREASGYLSAHTRPGDLILLCGSDHLSWPVEYYMQKQNPAASVHEINDRVNREDEAAIEAGRKNIWLVRLEKAEEPCTQIPQRLERRLGDATAVTTTARGIDISVYAGR
ncbi:MAG: glycosyltransferase family 39 protein [Sulfurifustis sp.]